MPDLEVMVLLVLKRAKESSPLVAKTVPPGTDSLFSLFEKACRPSQNTKPLRMIWKIMPSGAIMLDTLERTADQLARFLIVCNVFAADALSDEALFVIYKEQGSVEREFRYLTVLQSYTAANSGFFLPNHTQVSLSLLDL